MTEKTLSRRSLIIKTVEISGVTMAAGLGLMSVSRENRGEMLWRPRPPGALEEEVFLTHCSHCGQCVVACPYDSLLLGQLGSGVALGTPYFKPETIPCYMCEDMPCVKACPTGALKSMDSINEASMGVAVIDPSSCLSWQGLRCEVCFRACPRSEEAITIELEPRKLSKHAMFVPLIHPEACTGCGLCEKSCPMDQSAIRIYSRQKAIGQVGHHYQLGWLEGDDPKNQRTIENDAAQRLDNSHEVGGLSFLNKKKEGQ